MKITVYTPTYNRADLLPTLYKSLLKQTYQNFEWLIIDDGSSDNTRQVVDDFISQEMIDIRYFYKKNGGQHTALNMGIEKAEGTLLMDVDSDDYLTDNALERIAYWESTIAGKEGYAGVSGLKMHFSGEQIGQKWSGSKEYIDATNLERKALGLLGDKAEAYYVEVLKKCYPIPVFEGENDVEKGVLWDRVAYAGYKIRWFNEKIYCCEYLESGMSKNMKSNYIKNFQGFTYWRKQSIKMQSTYKEKLCEGAFFVEIAIQKRLSIGEMAELVEESVYFIFFSMVYRKLRKVKHAIKRKMQGNI
ncbi:MAG: glycosyltransferase family 2 protein [Bacteroidales bacterium]|nr:glycosyltransferase family 2 protein [Lachnoclostridium sp.]MCM1384124.1 glycosyltransferase family 2 protein [Lachnoclostridium sp.]MCM1465684.1 glycosyltransferase family 2 protein [Bacteroidales bacterium]